MQKKPDTTSVKLKISSKIFLEKVNPVPSIEYLKIHGTGFWAAIFPVLDRPLEYIQDISTSFSGQVNIDVTVSVGK